MKRIIRSQRESNAERASLELVNRSGIFASSIDAVDAAEGDDGDCGEVGSLLLEELCFGVSWIT